MFATDAKRFLSWLTNPWIQNHEDGTRSELVMRQVLLEEIAKLRATFSHHLREYEAS